MKIIYGLNQIKRFRKPVVAIGVFDGVHRGHRAILKAAAGKARRIGGTAIVLTFWPHPQKQASLYSLEHRLRLISKEGIGLCVVINFNRSFARLSAEDFIKNVLYKKLHPAYVYIGKNFNFGRKAAGSFRTLRDCSKSYSFKLRVFGVQRAGRLPISSTHIRALIRKGRLEAAGLLLGRRVSVLGTVIKGDARGAKLGYPTANIDPHHEVIPPSGVYAVRVTFGRRRFGGVCNIGTKPTFKHTGERHIEVYIFNFNRDIYGRYLELEFIKRIRGEKRYRASSALSARIKKDVIAAKKILSRHLMST